MKQPDAAVVANLLRESMTQGKVPHLTVTSNSMRPLLQKGDQVGLRPTAPSELAPGDVVVVRDGRTFLTHRFWGTQQADGHTHLLTRGDRPLTLDPPWTPDCYVGRVAQLQRSGRTLALDRGAGRWLNRHLGRLARLEVRAFSNAGPAARWPRRVLFAYAVLVSAICHALGRAIGPALGTQGEQTAGATHQSNISAGEDDLS